MNLDEYIKIKYKNDKYWFVKEVEDSLNRNRIAKIFNLKNYLNGQHKVKGREDLKYKDKEFTVKKLILQNAKTILNFHLTYLLGNNVSLTGKEDIVKKMNDVYKYGNYNNVDFELLDNLIKFGSAYEYIYTVDDRIKSKSILPEDSYPVYSETMEYVAFIEHYNNLENISYYNVYTPENVISYSNEGGNIHIIDSSINKTGLPILYGRDGEGLLENIIPLLDEIEDLLSKMGDSIYTLSLNPLLLTTGQAIEGGMSKDAVGFNIGLEMGSDMRYVNAEMDYNTIKYYLDTINNNLNLCAYMPSILGGNSNVANVSEVSLKLLYQLADVYAMLNERVLRAGMDNRLNIIRELLNIGKDDDNYINIVFNYSRPSNATELLDNLKKQHDMGAISVQTVIEKSVLTSDVNMELDRLKRESITDKKDK